MYSFRNKRHRHFLINKNKILKLHKNGLQMKDEDFVENEQFSILKLNKSNRY